MAAGGYAERPAGTLGTLRLQTTGLLSAFNKSGAPDPAREAAQIAMERSLPLTVVCRVLGAPRSTVYARRRAGAQPGRHGPVPTTSDEVLVRLIRQVLADSPFAGEATARSGPGCAASMTSG